jgi:hypothetical protein
VDVLPAGVTEATTVGCIGRPACSLAAVAGDRVPRHQDAPEPLDVDVEQLARALTLVALGRLKP